MGGGRSSARGQRLGAEADRNTRRKAGRVHAVSRARVRTRAGERKPGRHHHRKHHRRRKHRGAVRPIAPAPGPAPAVAGLPCAAQPPAIPADPPTPSSAPAPSLSARSRSRRRAAFCGAPVFGPAPGQAEALAAQPIEAVVQSLTRPSAAAVLHGPAPTDDEGNALAPADAWGHDHCWWLDRMVRSDQAARRADDVHLAQTGSPTPTPRSTASSA